jgi:hypothetical protein
MRALKGTRLDYFPLSDLNKVTDLIHFEGPLLSLFRNNEGDKYLYYWCDSGDDKNRWLVFRISDRELDSYLTKRATLRDLLLNPSDGFVYVADISENTDLANLYILDPRDLPTDYLADENSYYEFTQSSLRIAENPAESKASETYKIAIDGDWTLQDLAEMPKIYSTVYSFIYSLKALRTRTRDFLHHAYRAHPWRGGYSALNFFNNLQAYIDPEHRLQIVSMRYASPGWIELNISSPVAFSVKSIVASFVASADELEDLYKWIYSELRERELLRGVDLSSEDMSLVQPGFPLEVRELGVPSKSRRKRTIRPLSREDEQFASKSAMQLAGLLKLEREDFEQINSLTANPLTTLKILLTVYRRIRVLAEYHVQGKANY